MTRWIALALLLSVAAMAHAEMTVRLSGLMPGRAVLEVNGQTKLMKPGDIFFDITLVDIGDRQALLEYKGETMTVPLNGARLLDAVSGVERRVKMYRTPNGHYLARGTINSQPVRFMVDTGATHVSMSSVMAEELGLPYTDGELGLSSTANGMVQTWVIPLGKITVGEITFTGVTAAVIRGRYPDTILLGNSFLQRVKIEQENGAMIFSATQ